MSSGSIALVSPLTSLGRLCLLPSGLSYVHVAPKQVPPLCINAHIEQALLEQAQGFLDSPSEELYSYSPDVCPDSLSIRAVLGVATIAIDFGVYFQKPQDSNDLRCILQKVRGKVREYVTAYYLLDSVRGHNTLTIDRTSIQILDMTDGQIEACCLHPDWLESVGGIPLLGTGLPFISHTSGNLHNAVGLDPRIVVQLLNRLSIPTPWT